LDREGADRELVALARGELIFEPVVGSFELRQRTSFALEALGADLVQILEHTLDVEIANLISDRSHDDGYTIIKDLELFAKIELFYNLAFPRVSYAYKRKQQKTNNLNSIRKKIENITVLRNKIAHAKWYTLDKEGYVRVDMKTSKEDGVIKFRKFKMTPALIRKGIRDIEALDEKLSLFVEDNVWG
jgi:hypothetical protein